MAKILFISPHARDRRELSFLNLDQKYPILLDTYSQRWEHEGMLSGNLTDRQIAHDVAQLIRTYSSGEVSSFVTGFDYPGLIVTAVLNDHFGIRGPCFEAVLKCQHKYYSRTEQQRLVPEAVPDFRCITRDESQQAFKTKFSFPVIVKPIKAALSFNAFKVNTQQELLAIMPDACVNPDRISPFNYLMKQYSDYNIDAGGLLIEQFIDGQQCTLEGFVYNSRVGLIGIVDSIMFPGTISFKRFEYPSSLSSLVQDRMFGIAKQVMGGIRFNNGLFNIEFIYDQQTNQIKIIEINPRMSTQFADLFHKVDGKNSYEILCQIALGVEPTIQHRRGRYAIAASCVLRVFEDKKIVGLPDQQICNQLITKYPDLRIELFGQLGQRLSELRQDTQSFRYGVINCGASNRDELLKLFQDVSQALQVHFG